MSRTDHDLDLSKVGSDEHEKLAGKITSYYNQDSTTKLSLTYSWERNHLFLDGHQWLIFNDNNATGRQWEPIRLHRANEYIPRPVTNYLYDAYQTLKGYLTQTKPRSTVWPNSSAFQDKQAAKVAELINECNWERLKEENNYDFASGGGVLYGTMFKKDYWDTTVLQMAEVPVVEEQPVTDPMTGAVLGYEPRQVLDPETGAPMTEKVPLGDVNTEIIEPYRMALDPLATDLHALRWIMQYSIMPVKTVREMYDKQEDGFTGQAKEIKPEKQLSSALRRFYELRTSSGVKNGAGYMGFASSTGSTDEMLENATVVKEYYEAPSEKHPDGRLIVVASGKTLYAGPSPYSGSEMGDWHPYSDFRWEVVPGRFWGKSPLDQVAELQKRINSIDSAVILTRKTMAVPQKLIPKGSGIKQHSWTGRPGQQIEFRPVDGAMPSTVPPAGVDPQVWREREQAVEDIKAISGAIDILKGDRPPGVTAASALEMLYETATGKLRPVLDRWKRFIESSQKKQLKLISQKYREPREEFIRLLQAKAKDLPEAMLENFIGTDLKDNCNVIIEAGSNVPKLESLKKARVLEAAQTGALMLEVPENRMQFLEDLGITGYAQDISPDVKRAEWENDVIDNMVRDPDTQPVVLMVDDHSIHMEVHARRMKEPSFMDLDETVQQAYMAHYEEHRQQVEQEQMMAAQQAMMGNAQPAPQDMTQPGEDLDARGKGVPQDVAQALQGAGEIPIGSKV